jgi:antitoxin (DNA-binding transcriptional repressor) of toxin-antitoxin stability system
MNTNQGMTIIPISKFKATCLAVLARVRKTGQSVTVTRYGKALAQVIPPTAAERHSSWLGCMSGKSRIVGDVLSPVSEEIEWEALQK